MFGGEVINIYSGAQSTGCQCSTSIRLSVTSVGFYRNVTVTCQNNVAAVRLSLLPMCTPSVAAVRVSVIHMCTRRGIREKVKITHVYS